MINYARQKDTWVDEIEVSQSVYKFDTRRLIKINWIKEPDYETMQDVCKIMSLLQKQLRSTVQGYIMCHSSRLYAIYSVRNVVLCVSARGSNCKGYN